MRTFVIFATLFFTGQLLAQSPPAPAREADFTSTTDGPATRFAPQFPPLQQIAGAPEAYYSCFWEFGDGHFSFEENPMHAYAKPGEYAALLELTNNYDDGKKPKKKKKPVLTGGGTGTAMAGVFTKNEQTIALKTSSQPKAGEALTCIVSYRNNSKYATDGRLHLFFNERKFPAAHFRFDTARTYFGEMSDNAWTFTEPAGQPAGFDWATLFEMPSGGGLSTLAPAEVPFAADAQEMLAKARKAYRGEQVWRFTQLRPGEKRNLFVDLSGTANMLKDTTAFIHLEGVIAPFDPAIPPDRFELEIEIVSSHDPNAIAVSDNRVNYRFLKRQTLDYKVRFQNNGEGPASTVRVDIEAPGGLDLARMRPVDWYPACPICPKTPGTGSCLDTATTQDGLIFTFWNIYLPGSRQKGVSDRDSTQGFVKYRLEPEPGMPKRAFRSRAKIVFDKNPPIYTNFSKTRFTPGLSPGVKAGYSFDPGEPGEGYFFAGVSISPYKSWKIFPQVELLTGLKGNTALPEHLFQDSMVVADADFKRVTYRDSTVSGERRFVSLEMPVLLRKNFSRFFGAGAGASVRLQVEDGEDRTFVKVTRVIYTQPGVPPQPTQILRAESTTAPYSATNTQFSLFGELNLGLVRAGPALNLRIGVLLGEGVSEPFGQAGLEWKF